MPRQSELMGLAASAPVANRRQARFNLARFYLARDMAPEAKAVLNVALGDQRGSEEHHRKRAHRGRQRYA